MLVLSRKNQESIRISDNITVTVMGIQGNKVRLGIDAPKEISILRSELKSKILDSLSDDSKKTVTPNIRVCLTQQEQECK